MHLHVLRAGVIVALAALLGPEARLRAQESYRFRTGIELINVTATVTDSAGRRAAGLTKADFTVYEDDVPVDIRYFSAERVPVSLGIILDTSGSMRGEKLAAARSAVERFLFELLGPEDEFFVYRFDNAPHLVAGWTRDRDGVAGELAAVRADGATALYDAIAEALPRLHTGRHAKKALLVISDGNDSSSRLDLPGLKQLIRESDAVVYAIGIDAQTAVGPRHGGIPRGAFLSFQRRRPMPRPMPMPPFPMPGRRPPPRPPVIPGTPPGTGAPAPGKADRPGRGTTPETEPVDAAALHALTDASGGRTEIVRNTLDLTSTASRIADELGQQYFLAYASRDARDGAWHTIRVEVADRSLRVRARSGYLAR